MHIFKKRLKNVSEKIDKKALVVQRLKKIAINSKKVTKKI